MAGIARCIAQYLDLSLVIWEEISILVLRPRFLSYWLLMFHYFCLHFYRRSEINYFHYWKYYLQNTLFLLITFHMVRPDDFWANRTWYSHSNFISKLNKRANLMLESIAEELRSIHFGCFTHVWIWLISWQLLVFEIEW